MMPSIAADGTTAGAAPWRFRDDIQGLRAVAILLVVAYHAAPHWLPGGYLGVDVFFVVSGFLITGIVTTEVERTGQLSLVRFWARRARRLMPAALVMMTVTLLLASFLSSPFALSLHARTASLAALYGSNFLYLGTNADYFAINAQPNVLLHTWSLSVEEQFYLGFAPLIAGIAWLGRRGRIGYRPILTVTLAALTAASFAGALWLASSDRVAAFYLLPTRFWELAAGAILAVRREQVAGVVSRLHARGGAPVIAAVGALALAAIIGVSRAAGERTAHPGWITVVPVLATTLLLAVGTGPWAGAVTRALSWRPFGVVGQLSYSWYLWHWPLLVLLGEVVGYPSTLARLATVTVALAAAWVSYRWVEAPVHRSVRLARLPALSVAGALALSAVVALGARKVWGHAGRQQDAPELAEARASSARPPLECMGALEVGRDRSLCAFGPAQAPRTVVLLGDSHMAQWFAALQPLAEQGRIRLVALVRSGCPAPFVHVERNRSHLPYTDCDRWRERAIDLAERLQPDVVLVSSWHQYGVILDGVTRVTTDDDRALDAWARGTDSTLRRLARRSERVVLLRDSPMPGIVVRDCLTTRVANPERCAAPRELAVDTTVAARERDVAARIPGVEVVDLTDEICEPTSCPALRDSVIVYRDQHHLSNAFVLSLGEQLERLVLPADPGR